MRKILILFSAIALLLFIIGVRFYRLGNVPVHLGNDEISFAYDAYSIGLTLRDEHNHFLPLSLQSHGDYKAPLYAYLSVLPIKILGNTEVAVRLVSAIAGLLTIVTLGLLAFKMSGNKVIGALSAIVLALSPWHIYTSRIAFETNLAFFLVVLAIYLFLLFVDNQKRTLLLIGSSLAFGLSIYAYHTEKILSPLLVLFLPLFYPLKSLFKKYFYWFMSAVLCLPYFFEFLHQVGTNARANTEMVWNYPGIYDYLHSSHPIVLKISILLNAIISNYSAHINPGYLFFNGLPLFPQKTFYQFGLLLAASLPFIIVGLLAARKYFGKHSRFLILWAAFSPVVTSLSRGDPNLGRNLPSIAPYSILIATGLVVVWPKAGKPLKAIIVLSHLLFLLFFLAFYFFHFPVFSGENWQYGYKQIALTIKPLYPKYKRIVVDSRFGPYSRFVGVANLYLPYFTNLSPEAMFKTAENGGRIGKYEIREIDWKSEINIEPGCLYVLPESNLPPPGMKSFRLLKIIELPTRIPAFRIFETLPVKN